MSHNQACPEVSLNQPPPIDIPAKSSGFSMPGWRRLHELFPAAPPFWRSRVPKPVAAELPDVEGSGFYRV